MVDRQNLFDFSRFRVALFFQRMHVTVNLQKNPCTILRDLLSSYLANESRLEILVLYSTNLYRSINITLQYLY